MRSLKRTTVLSLIAAALMILPAAAPSAAEDPAVDPFATFTYSGNMKPVGSSLRPPPSPGLYNSDLAFWGTKAYQGTYDGFRIIDIANPSKPEQLIDYRACSGSSASNQGDVIVWGDILVRSWNSATTGVGTTCGGQMVLPGFEGLHIFDVKDPKQPRLVGQVQLPCGSHTATGVPDPANARLLVYNSASSATCPWIEIVSVPLATPSAAALVNLAPTGRGCHDTNVILGSAMYAACAGGNGFTVFSIGGARGGTLTNPVELYRRTVDGVSIGHTAAFSWDGEVLIFGHEPGGGSAPRCRAEDPDVLKSLFFYKAVDGTPLGTWVLPRPQTAAENCTVHNLNVVPTTDGSRILVSGNYQSGIAVVDFTDPAAATEIAFADPAPLAATLQLGGDWSTYWYNGHIYESDITRGLLVWELDDDRVRGALTLPHVNPQTQDFTIPRS
jgi:hypothetical protein